MSIDTRQIDLMLAELKSASALTGGKSPSAGQATAEDFSSGQGEVNLQDVMINLQKASLSFQQMVQVRNRLVSAYHDIMNIQV